MTDVAGASAGGATVRQWPDDRPDGPTGSSAASRVRDSLPWATWAACVGFAVWQVANYARRLPYVDDYPFIPWVHGERAVTAAWLWRQSSEHRMIATKLVEVAVGRFAGGDFGVQVWVNLVILAVLSAAALVALRRMRGRGAWGDAFVPLLLLAPQLPALHRGHAHFLLNSLAACILLLVAARFGLDVPVRWCWVGVGGLVLLWGGGGPGLAMLPGFGAWLLWVALRRRRTDRARSVTLLVALGLVGLASAAYFVGWEGVPSRSPDPAEVVTTALRAATAPGGNAVNDWWPLSGLAVGVALALTIGLVVLRLADPATRVRNHSVAVALACTGVSVVVLLLAIGFGRGTRPFTVGLEQHYSDAVLPVALWAYLAWDRLVAGGVRTAAGALLALAALGSVWQNTGEVLDRYRVIQRQQEAFVVDFCAGVSPERLTRRYYTPLLFYNDLDTTRLGFEAVPEGIRTLRAEWDRTFCD